MKIGVPKEIKSDEYRVGLTPFSVHELVANGHEVYVEHHAGFGINFFDDHYLEAGAKILNSAANIYAIADMIIKVKEPQPSEFPLLREGQILFTYLHLAPDPRQSEALLQGDDRRRHLVVEEGVAALLVNGADSRGDHRVVGHGEGQPVDDDAA